MLIAGTLEPAEKMGSVLSYLVGPAPACAVQKESSALFLRLGVNSCRGGKQRKPRIIFFERARLE